MDNAYYNPANPAAFGGVERLQRHLKGKKTKKEVKEWLSGQTAYTLHKPVRKRFARTAFVHLVSGDK